MLERMLVMCLRVLPKSKYFQKCFLLLNITFDACNVLYKLLTSGVFETGELIFSDYCACA